MLEPSDEVFAAPEGARRCARRHIAQHGRGFVQRGAIVLVQRFVYELFLDFWGIAAAVSSGLRRGAAFNCSTVWTSVSGEPTRAPSAAASIAVPLWARACELASSRTKRSFSSMVPSTGLPSSMLLLNVMPFPLFAIAPLAVRSPGQFQNAALAWRRSASWLRRVAIVSADAASVSGKFTLWNRISSPSLLNSLGGSLRNARGRTSNSHAEVNTGVARRNSSSEPPHPFSAPVLLAPPWRFAPAFDE